MGLVRGHWRALLKTASVKVVEFLDQLSNYWVLRKDCATGLRQFPFCRESLDTPILKTFSFGNCAERNNGILHLASWARVVLSQMLKVTGYLLSST
jgi:hypothetical protein